MFFAKIAKTNDAANYLCKIFVVTDKKRTIAGS